MHQQKCQICDYLSDFSEIGVTEMEAECFGIRFKKENVEYTVSFWTVNVVQRELHRAPLRTEAVMETTVVVAMIYELP